MLALRCPTTWYLVVGDWRATDMPNTVIIEGPTTATTQGKRKTLFPRFPSNKVAFQSCQRLKILYEKHNDCSLQEKR